MMWNRYGMAITAISLGLTASLVSYDIVHAARIRNYTPREMRAILNGFGYNIPVSDAPLTDAAAINAVRDFQRGYKLQVDGIAGPQTQDLMAQLVTILQANLNLVVKPNPPLPRTPFFGTATQDVVKQYQQQAGLPVTGIATLEVRKRLDDEATRILGGQSTPTTKPAPAPSPSPSPTPTPIPRPRATPPAPRPTLTPVPRITPTPSPLQTPRSVPSPTLPSPGGTSLPAPRVTPSP